MRQAADYCIHSICCFSWCGGISLLVLASTQPIRRIRMVEGWLGSDYFILYVDSEMALASERYGIGTWLPGFDILGLRNWDDFIIRDSAGHTYTVPTVPIMRQYVTSYVLPNDLSLLRDDEDLRGKVKWYVKPLVFGGAISHENMTWMSHKAHGEAVRWWNDLYRSTKHPS